MLSLCSLCVMVVNRYDLLADCLRSASKGTLVPDGVYVIHNGKHEARLVQALEAWTGLSYVHTPEKPTGVAEGWNWFIDNVPEERIITNDDVVFGPDSIAAMVESPGEFVSSLAGSNAFSCFLIRDTCVHEVGKFDETISPGYVYFEDCDYIMRMREKNIAITPVDCGVVHVGSGTLAARPPHEVNEHNRKFKIAQQNYLNKWGKMPDGVVEQR